MKLTLLKDNLKRFGITKTLQELIYLFINKVCFFKILQGMTLTLETLPRSFLEAPLNYDCSFLSEEQILRFSQDESNYMDSDFVNDAIAKGDKCFGLIENGSLESYGWYANSATAINDELRLCFDTSWTYMYKGYTKPSSRGKRLHAIGMAMALEALTASGSKGLISYVEAPNFRSLRSTARMGYRNFGKIYILKAFNKLWTKTDKECLPYEFAVKAVNLSGRVTCSEKRTVSHSR